MPKLSISNLHYSVQGKAIFNDLSLSVSQNEILCLLGASGCGKTTVLKMIAGLLEPQQGEIHIDGKQVNGDGIFVAPEFRNIGMIFQDYALFPHLTVADNIAFGLRNLAKAVVASKVETLLTLVKLEGLAARYPHQLSGGQQQRVAIARALAYSPQLLLLDEPFSNIDTQVRHALVEDIRGILKSQHIAAVFVTHSKEEGFAFADQMAVMNDGRIEQLDTPEILFNHPETTFVAEFLGKGVYLPAKVLSATSVETRLGTIGGTSAMIHAVGTEGQLFVRPQYFCLNAVVGVNATITHKCFVGSGYTYQIAFGDLEIDVFSVENLDPGSGVHLSLNPHRLHLFAG